MAGPVMPDIQPAAADFQRARQQLEAALDDPFLATEAHYLLWEVCQACGDRDGALTHLRAAMKRNPLRTRVGSATTMRSVLALATPGDFQANLPIAMLLDQSTMLHTLWLADPQEIERDPRAAIPPDLPPIDCVFITIAEDAQAAPALRAADLLAQELGVPIINNGRRIERLSRTGAALLLEDIVDAVVPLQQEASRAGLGLTPPAAPFVIRPRGRHAGDGLALIRDVAALGDYLARDAGPDAFFVAPFIDYRSQDGLYRKLRVVFVAGVPYPLHMAIHEDWAVWYYNAHMEQQPWKGREEQRFLDDMASAVGDQAMAALHEIGRRVDLDYFGLDCAVMPDGRLLVFEVETGMIVHDDTSPRTAARGESAAVRILRAVEQMIDARRLVLAPPCTLPAQRSRVEVMVAA